LEIGVKRTFKFLATVQATGAITTKLVKEPVHLQYEVLHFGIDLHDHNALIGIYISTDNIIGNMPTGEQTKQIIDQARLEVSRLIN
jgi:hypothetical protein